MFWGAKGHWNRFWLPTCAKKCRWFGCPPSRCWNLRSRAITGPPSIKVLKVFLEEMRIQNGVLSCCCVNPVCRLGSFWKCSPHNKLQKRLARKVTSKKTIVFVILCWFCFIWWEPRAGVTNCWACFLHTHIFSHAACLCERVFANVLLGILYAIVWMFSINCTRSQGYPLLAAGLRIPTGRKLRLFWYLQKKSRSECAYALYIGNTLP